MDMLEVPPVAYPELVSGGGGGGEGYKSHKIKWVVKVGASNGVISVDLKKSWPGVPGNQKKPGYAIDQVKYLLGRFATCNGNTKAVRAFPGVTESTLRCLQNNI